MRTPQKKDDKTVMSIKTDRAVKERAMQMAHDIGIPLGTILNAYLRKFVSTGEVAFEAPLRPSKYLRGILDENRKDKSKRHVSHSPQELFAWLDK